MKLRIYADTSVIGGCFDDKFKDTSRLLLEKFKKGEMVLVLSDLTQLEIKDAPLHVQAMVKTLPETHIERVVLTKEAADLAKMYIAHGIVRKASLADAQHIALASISRVDALVSWNFKHIVNLERIRGYNSINLRYGYPPIEIRTPWEVIGYGS
jgi:hypothetical protein